MNTNSIYYTAPDFYNMTSNDSLTILSNYKTYQQTTDYTCAPASAITILRHFNNNDFDEMTLAEEMKTQIYPIGTSPDNVVKFFQKINWKVRSSLTEEPFNSYEDFQTFIINNLKNNIPIMVENVEWGGHWRVIIGYDKVGTNSTTDDVIIFADPYDTGDHNQDGYTIDNGEKFFEMWFDHYMLPENQRNQVWITVHP